MKKVWSVFRVVFMVLSFTLLSSVIIRHVSYIEPDWRMVLSFVLGIVSYVIIDKTK